MEKEDEKKNLRIFLKSQVNNLYDFELSKYDPKVKCDNKYLLVTEKGHHEPLYILKDTFLKKMETFLN